MESDDSSGDEERPTVCGLYVSYKDIRAQMDDLVTPQVADEWQEPASNTACLILEDGHNFPRQLDVAGLAELTGAARSVGHLEVHLAVGCSLRTQAHDFEECSIPQNISLNTEWLGDLFSGIGMMTPLRIHMLLYIDEVSFTDTFGGSFHGSPCEQHLKQCYKDLGTIGEGNTFEVYASNTFNWFAYDGLPGFIDPGRDFSPGNKVLVMKYCPMADELQRVLAPLNDDDEPEVNGTGDNEAGEKGVEEDGVEENAVAVNGVAMNGDVEHEDADENVE